jgi:hypothetical protein
MAENQKSRSQKASDILKTQGLKSLIKTGGIFISQLFYLHMQYYLYEHSLIPRDEKNFLPKTNEFAFFLVSNRREIDELISNGFDLDPQADTLRNVVQADGVSFCFFIKKKIAHIGYVGFSQPAQIVLSQPSYRIDFTKGDAFTGGAWTHPDYRSLGLAVYCYYKRLEYLRNQGRLAARAAVRTDNIASQKMHAKFFPKKRTLGHQYRILGCTFWREQHSEVNG